MKKGKREKVILASVISIFSIITCLSIMLLLYHLQSNRKVQYIGIFTDGNNFWYTSLEGEDTLYRYDLDTKKSEKILNEKVKSFLETENDYFYDNGEGFYRKNKETGEKNRIAEGGDSIVEADGKLYFVEYIREDILNPENDKNGIGFEAWTTLYEYDIATQNLKEIKNMHMKADYLAGTGFKDLSMHNLYVSDEKIYYQNETTIRCISLADMKDEVVYHSNGKLRMSYLKENSYVVIDSMLDEYPGGKKDKWYIRSINLETKERKVTELEGIAELRGAYDQESMGYDLNSDAYLMITRDIELISLSEEGTNDIVTMKKFYKYADNYRYKLYVVENEIYALAIPAYSRGMIKLEAKIFRFDYNGKLIHTIK